jgi:hypothetical protein
MSYSGKLVDEQKNLIESRNAGNQTKIQLSWKDI